MKYQNALIVKYLQPVISVYTIKNIILVKKLKNIVENLRHIAFVIYSIFKKKDINKLQKHTILHIK